MIKIVPNKWRRGFGGAINNLLFCRASRQNKIIKIIEPQNELSFRHFIELT